VQLTKIPVHFQWTCCWVTTTCYCVVVGLYKNFSKQYRWWQATFRWDHNRSSTKPLGESWISVPWPVKLSCVPIAQLELRPAIPNTRSICTHNNKRESWVKKDCTGKTITTPFWSCDSTLASPCWSCSCWRRCSHGWLLRKIRSCRTMQSDPDGRILQHMN
jgi:hypothetical protein